jgi:hypothetical protein
MTNKLPDRSRQCHRIIEFAIAAPSWYPAIPVPQVVTWPELLILTGCFWHLPHKHFLLIRNDKVHAKRALSPLHL